ncbi:MAG: ABC transporter permease [Ginsengibacter sp.]
MIKNYLKIAFRNLARHKAFSTINISGLAIGIASALLLFTVVKYELSYNTTQPDYSNIYHVVTQDKTPDGIFYTPGIPFPALAALRIDFPEVTTGALLANFGSQVTVLDNEKNNTASEKKFIEETGFFFCDPQFFKVFHYDWLVGNPELLSEPNVTVLTQSNAIKYFGDWKNATGKFLKLDNAIVVKVVGILKDPPLNSDYNLGIVTSYETAKRSNGVYFYSDEWGATTSNFQIFFQLPENISKTTIGKRLARFSEKNYTTKRSGKRSNFLQPLSEVHFDKRFESFGDHVTNKSTLWTLSIIGLFIILMACINFINLSTAQAVGRSKEIGIRKVLGGHRRQLFGQVMGETIMIVLISVLLAIGIASICLPFIKDIALIHETVSLFNPQTLIFIFSLIVVVTLFAGLYPAIILSGFNPSLALKNKITSATIGGISIRRGLVITQFAVSQVLIIGTLIAVMQMDFVKNADLGFNKEAILIIDANTDSTVHAKEEAFKINLLQLPGVKAASFASDVPSSQNNSATNFTFDHKPPPEFTLYLKFADEDYFKTFGIEFLAGRTFSKSDTINEIVVNETLVKKLGVHSPESIIGKDILYGEGGDNWKRIVGVVKDFKTNSLKEDIKPLAIAQDRKSYDVATIKMSSSNIPKTRAAVESAWNKFYPEYAFTSNYLDDNIAEFYRQDDQLSLLYKIFAGIAIFISCLGLYGLVTFMAVQRTKEIGIRKVLGASVQNIVYLFSKEFTILILVGFLVAVPVAWYMMDGWLQNFVYRVKISPGVFLLAGVFAIVVAWLAVGYKSVKAALANPVKSLRSE